MKKKVLIIQGYGNQKGGVVTFLRYLVKYLDKNKFEPIILFLSQGELVGIFQSMEVKVGVINSGRLSNVILAIITILRILWLIYRERIDIVFSNDCREHIYGGIAAYFAGIPSTFFWHGFPSISSLGKISVIIHSDCVFPSNNDTQIAIRQKYPKRKICYIKYGIEIPSIQPKDILRAKLNLDPQIPIITQIAAFMPWKGHKYLINAMVYVINHFPEAKLLIVGDIPFESCRPYKEEIMKLVRELKIENNVIFTGYIKEVIDFIGASDIIVQPSTYDPFPLTILIALAYYKPVIATNVGGPKEIINNWVDGILVPPYNSKAIGDAILTLLKDKNLCKEMGIRGREKVEKYFHVERMVKEISDVWEKLVTSHR